jgi:mannose-6-phosphate isomerase-like protein (cupin superfamily)
MSVIPAPPRSTCYHRSQPSMTTSLRIFAAIVMLLTSAGAIAQTMSSDHWSREQLLERAQHLRQLAAQGDGSASETLEKYPHHYTMLAFRSRSGGGELHADFADMFTILDGHATLVTGGEVVDAKTTAPGETRGTAVKGGTRQELRAGDSVHIPAGMPHQMLVADGDTITYFVIKIQEKP